MSSNTLVLQKPAIKIPFQAKVAEVAPQLIAPQKPVDYSRVCDVHIDDFCIVSGNFIFQQPVDNKVAGPFAESYRYGMNEDGRRTPHRGVDFPAAVGTPVLAVADGEIVFAGFEETTIYSPWVNYYGKFIVIRHANDMFTLYAHLSRIDVKAGQKVKVGETIGAVGRTGVAIGPHLHFEVRRGANGEDFLSTENPELWLTLVNDKNASLYGAISVTFDADIVHKVQRNIEIEYFPGGAVTPEKVIHTFTYPLGFERNAEDAVLSKLEPGRYRIWVYAKGQVLLNRWVRVESGRLTQVYMLIN
jgi:murein DD-endopeptidase MepM/ murein hydrolase activator NlpD